MADFGITEALALAGTAVSAGAGLAGASASAAAQRQAANTANQADQMQALALQRSADEKTAASQRAAITQGKQRDLLLSRQQAIAGASGAGATDPTILNLMGDTAGQGEYNALSALYQGTSAATGLNEQADLDIYKGQSTLAAAPIAAQATMLSGLSSFGSTLAKAKWPTSF